MKTLFRLFVLVVSMFGLLSCTPDLSTSGLKGTKWKGSYSINGSTQEITVFFKSSDFSAVGVRTYSDERPSETNAVTGTYSLVYPVIEIYYHESGVLYNEQWVIENNKTINTGLGYLLYRQ